MDLLQSHEIESEHTDEEPTVNDNDVESVVNPGASLPLSQEIESEPTDEEPTVNNNDVEAVVNPGASLPLSHEIESEPMDEEPTINDNDVEAIVNPGASLPLSCDNDALINMETCGFNIDQMEAENTQVEGQASDLFLRDDIMDLIDGYCKQSNVELVNYSLSSGSALPGDIFATNENVCHSNEHSYFIMSGTLKQPIDVML